ncbi:MAG: DNA-3-methyladenine glycosylase I, partial [Alphaproteobacteria bacterium]|nr:DNA-3-methyladenine glycosylase I [Alphaproteobacteria bacterium]
PVHGPYHDVEYGFPVTEERILFERLSLEIMQAGLSWEIVLKKRKALNKAFNGFRPLRVAAYGAADVERLLTDEGIIRNRLKIGAIIVNAETVLAMRKSHGGFAQWIEAQHPLGKEDWIRLFKKTFKFMGGEIAGEFLMSVGYLPGAHERSCPVFKKIAALGPPWARKRM